jgi:hypothetical protein
MKLSGTWFLPLSLALLARTAESQCEEGWTPARWTYYESYATCCENSPNYDPNADRTECDEYSACKYTGAFAYIGNKSYDYVRTNNLVSFFTTNGDNASYGGKRMLVSARGKTIEVLVADTCGDDDCKGCCTRNAGQTGNVVDMEYNTVKNNFGGDPGSVAYGEICWKLDGGDSNPTPTPPRGTCGGGSRGDGVCSSGECCSEWGWCGTSSAHCRG